MLCEAWSVAYVQMEMGCVITSVQLRQVPNVYIVLEADIDCTLTPLLVKLVLLQHGVGTTCWMLDHWPCKQ